MYICYYFCVGAVLATSYRCGSIMDVDRCFGVVRTGSIMEIFIQK